MTYTLIAYCPHSKKELGRRRFDHLPTFREQNRFGESVSKKYGAWPAMKQIIS